MGIQCRASDLWHGRIGRVLDTDSFCQYVGGMTRAAALAELAELIHSVQADFADRDRNQRETLVMAEFVHCDGFRVLSQSDIDHALASV